ncbi:hypothetical protein HZU40_32915 [Mycolicibacterium fluoranthenivorans]|jgi:hypothetical protein|uniref:Ig-like domain-containing protein n=1 Tax=Mycolicibacterium fluoranthenivorans TaxID=258505 RepID=A0A1G4VHH2_9MYCO|nr:MULTISPECIES: DUF6636 domain-containing protein [Mycobacteriaceae]MCV7253963.1 hypothetical protein [Mycobacterium hackensackense]QNJ92850.1 hypothetical protein HZU40_32915 [Mycolicibacterium fluoranthenivorans]SCX06878.1 hypothetical protein SAMN02799620_00941 [Mycolicibacterium fluoranthenivorans]
MHTIVKAAVAVTAATAVAAFAIPATAQAAFQSPSSNITCYMGHDPNGAVSVTCAIAQKYWTAPPRPDDCHLDWGSRLRLEQALPARFACYGQSMPAPEQTLAYGTSLSDGTLVCYSKTTGITCSDTYTGHYFKVSREGYELG